MRKLAFILGAVLLLSSCEENNTCVDEGCYQVIEAYNDMTYRTAKVVDLCSKEVYEVKRERTSNNVLEVGRIYCD